MTVSPLAPYALRLSFYVLDVGRIDAPQVRVPLSEDRVGIGLQPIAQNRAVIGAKIVLPEQVSVLVEVVQSGRRTVDAFHRRVADDEVGPGGAMVRAQRSVLGNAAAELRPGHE